MKRIIWIFGEPGSGKKTLINNIINDMNFRDNLGLLTDKIAICDFEVIDRDKQKDYGLKNKRENAIKEDIKKFLNSDNDVFLVSAQLSDIEDNYDNMLKKIARKYPDLDKEIYLLQCSDIDLLYERFTNTEWFKSNPETYSEKFPVVWLDVSVKYMEDSINEYSNYGYVITKIDTTDGYIIENKSHSKKI